MFGCPLTSAVTIRPGRENGQDGRRRVGDIGSWSRTRFEKQSRYTRVIVAGVGESRAVTAPAQWRGRMMRVLDLNERVRVRATQQRGNRFRRAIPGCAVQRCAFVLTGSSWIE